MTNFKKKFVLIAINILLVQNLFILSNPAFADDGTIKIAGQPIFSLASASDSGAIVKRAETVQNNLDNALVAAQDRSPASVNITYVKGMPVITLGGYQVVTVGTQDATAANTTPALLANKWADAIRGSLVNQPSINSYVAQLSGNYALSAPTANLGNANTASNAVASASASGPSNNESYNNSAPNYNGGNSGISSAAQGYRQGRIVYAPAGQIIPVTLKTSIATQVAKAGDLIEASISQNVNMGESTIPAGTTVIGQVASAKAGGRLTKSGELQITFTQLRLPDGSSVPITAHIVGGIGKYAKGKEAGQVEGETWKNKVGSVAFRGLLGAGAGAALGTGVGAIAGGGYGAGMGAWSGAAIGSGVGAADSLILRKGKDVTVPSGTNIQLQLDQPVSISENPSQGYNNGSGSNQGGNTGYSEGNNAGGYNGAASNQGGSNYNSGAPGGGYNQQPQYNPPAVR